MELYGSNARSLPQKLVVFLLELVWMWLAGWILFQQGGTVILGWFGMTAVPGVLLRREILYAFNLIVFVRLSFMMFYLLKRAMPWAEVANVPIAFALYYIGYALLGYRSTTPVDGWDYLAIALFLAGSAFNSVGELQRHFWKQHPENKGRLYTQGLFGLSMHVNYFGDLLWVSAYALVTRNVWSITIPVFLFFFFVFFNIPQLDKYLASKYTDEFEAWRKRTKKFIPFLY